MKIIGDIRPYTGKTYQYTMTTDAGKFVKVETWHIINDKKVLTESKKGEFNFGISTAGKSLTLIGKVKNPKTGELVDYFTEIIPLEGQPKILEVYWRDVNGEIINNRAIAYQDKVTLVVKTANIPSGDKLKITIYEDDGLDGHGSSSRKMGEYLTQGITRKGYAFLEFNNIHLYQKILNDIDYLNELEHEFYIKVHYYNGKVDVIKDNIYLRIKNKFEQMVKPYTGVSPVKVDSVKKEDRKGINFTFGVFFDGTLNNMYNTEIRQKAEGKNIVGVTKNQPQALSIYNRLGDEDYKESSFENDLSNPAILFKNYKKDETVNQYRIYIEGIGTNTKMKNNTIDYQKDDVFQGPAFGIGSAGIVSRVREAIRKIVEQLKTISPKDIIGTITLDVFGFSRGAAAARHFVHVVTHPAYNPKVYTSEYGVFVKDIQGENLPLQYEEKTMPHYGLLGQLLQEANRLDIKTKVVVRFLGIYDTVPHHGFIQSNDAEDLGLNDINRANYIVHMVAADEHRYNFDLVDISSVPKNKGIELIYPGVHCDVGGSYVEGAPNIAYRIKLSSSKEKLRDERDELIHQGWFTKEQMAIEYYLSLKNAGINFRLEGKKQNVSSQYSYIPLHIMAEFCKRHKVPIDDYNINSRIYTFKDNWLIGNIDFLKKVKTILWDYSFNGGKPLIFNTAGTLQENDMIRKLRLHYLHWNATYGSIVESSGTYLSGKNKPNIVKGKRKRDVY